MGILYTVWPLGSDIREFLEDHDIHAPESQSRWPTSVELRSVLASFSAFDLDLYENGPGEKWGSFITEPTENGWSTLLHAEPDGGDDDSVHFSFEKGDPALIIAVVREIAKHTGPLVVIEDAGSTPVLVESHSDLFELSETWAGEEPGPRFDRLVSKIPRVAV